MPARVSFDRVAHCYDATRAVPPTAERAIVRGVVQELPADAHVLEVGIGTGRIAVPLVAAGVRLTGVDVAPAMLARLRVKRPDLPVAIAEAEHLPFGRATFDAVLLVHVLHLVADPARTLRQVATVLRPQGLLLRGRTQYTDSPRARVLSALQALVTELTGAPPPLPVQGTVTGLLADMTAAVGGRHTERELARWPERTTGREMLDGLARRLYSTTWSIPETVMPELLRRLEPETTALLGDLDREIVNEGVFVLETLRLPPATRSPSPP